MNFVIHPVVERTVLTTENRKVYLFSVCVLKASCNIL